MTYSEFRLELARRRPDLPLKEVDAAYEFAKAAHGDQVRYSGEPYIVHPVAVAQILLSLQPDLATLQAALLHDVTEDTEIKLEEIEKIFGSEVAKLVHGMDKLAVVKVRAEDQEAEKWKKMFLAMANDVRIVFIKLADRLHNMRTLHHVPPHKQERIARETLLVHAAIASRLGIYEIKGELEDLCFRYLYPREFAELSQELEELRARSEECMAFATSELEQLLFREGVAVEQVQGRFKHLWSIFQKLEKKDRHNLESIYDLFAVRIILPDVIRDGEEQVAHVYSTLGLIHSAYIPLQDRFKDYVAVPKPNGYRSLHTTVLGLGGELYQEPTEVQIRTMGMHRQAELGVASHWSYKLGAKGRGALDSKRQRQFEEVLKKVQVLVRRQPDQEGSVQEWLEDYQHLKPRDRKTVEDWLHDQGLSEDELKLIRLARSKGKLSLEPQMEEQLAWLRGLAESTEAHTELNLYSEHIFVLTPQRKVLELPRGATPVDFAYAVHTEVGNKMVNVKVNGRIVPFDYELQNGEMVEVLTRNNGKPSRYWLSMAQTASAKNKIRNWFHRQDKEANVGAGRDLLNKELASLGKPVLDEKYSLLKDYSGKERSMVDREQILENLGLGTVSVTQIVKTLFPEMAPPEKKREEVYKVSATLTEKVVVTGEENLPVVFSSCCKPKPPYPIIGYVTRGQSIRIHRLSCRELSGLDGQRFVSVHWKEKV
jgi:GTP pyrophosphokinase